MTAFSVPMELDLSPDQLFGYLASALVLMTFAMRSMQRLRYVAILSNVVFIYYAGALGLMPIFLLHAILLPLNLWRLIELWGEKPRSHADETREATDSPPVSTVPYAARTARQLVMVTSEGERQYGNVKVL